LGTLNSTLRFDNETEVGIAMQTLSLSASWRLDQNWSLRAGAGIILGGELSPEGGAAQELQPGGLVALGAVYQAVQGEGLRPFIDLSLFLSGSATSSRHPNDQISTQYTSSDLRLAGRTSWIVKDKIYPYISANVFGGPVFWTLNGEEVTGSDVHHYQVSLGSAVQFDQMTVFLDWAGLGEKAFSAGFSLSL
jgi:hypothetical protein